MARRFTTLRVNAEVCRLALNLPGDENEHIGGWCFFDAKCPAWKPQIGKVHSGDYVWPAEPLVLILSA